MTHRRPGGVAAALVALATTVVVAPGASAQGSERWDDDLVVEVVSNRADLVSGGDALVRITVPADAGVDPPLTVTAAGRDVSASFAAEGEGRAIGLVEDLPEGESTLEARLPDGRGARLTVTNHPRGGPIFAGPQITPWICTTAEHGLGNPIDGQCNAPTQISYLYQPVGTRPGDYRPYDPARPAEDVAQTTTADGTVVPYVVRVETGTLDRSIYRTMVLADPGRPWIGTLPQPAWNRKVLFSFAGGCGTPHRQHPPLAPGPLFGNTASDGAIQLPELLSTGWMTATTGLLSFNQNCNPLVSAEALMMLKEHIVDTSGPIRRAVGVGGSGGSVQLHYIATAYPGLLDGLVTSQSFPDLPAMTWDTADCALGTRYFLASPVLWLDPTDQLAALGKDGPVACVQFVTFFGDWFDPRNRGPYQLGAGVRTGCTLPEERTYHPDINPEGPRCSVQDYQRAIWGVGPDGAAPLPFDNVGVQYGRQALDEGRISAEQFVDLNARIGGIDAEGRYTPERSAMSPETAVTMYRAGQTLDARALADVPIIDVREVLVDPLPEALSDMHQPYNTRTLRARLDAANGTHANHVVWFPVPDNHDVRAVQAIDRWLDAVDADTSGRPRSARIVDNRPPDVVDTCWIGGRPETNPAACTANHPGVANAGNARIAAGAPITDDIRACTRKPLDPDDYPVAFDDGQWARLRATFPTGVCDWTQPSVGAQSAVPWLTFASGPGGRPLGPPPVSEPFDDGASEGPRGGPTLPATGRDAAPLLTGGVALMAALVLRRFGRAQENSSGCQESRHSITG